MKIAVACEYGKVAGHFGHCENFSLFDVENQQIIRKESLPNPGHKPGFLPNYLKSIGVDVIIAGGMGESAVVLFNGNGIEVVTGASGEPQNIVEKYLNGQLNSTGSVCHEHHYSEECHN